MREQHGHSGLMTVREFVDWSRISRSKMYEEIAAGRLVKTKVGRKTLISYEDALQWSWRQRQCINWATPHDTYGEVANAV